MATSVINNTITDPSGTVVGSVPVTATLMPSAGTGFRTASGTEIAAIESTTSDGAGAWSLTLERNADITPSGTYYRIDESIPAASGGPRTWYISVGASNQSLLAALVSAPPAIVDSTYLTQAAGDARYQQLGALGGTPSAIEPDDTAANGTDLGAARVDHQHQFTTAVPVRTDLDGTASPAEGSASTSARSDHQHVAENDAWTDWVPTLSNLTLGNGTITARYHRVGRTVHFFFSFVLGSTSAVGTQPGITLPFTMAAGISAGDAPLGLGACLDAGAANYLAIIQSAGGNNTQWRVLDTTSANGVYTSISATVPFTWGTGDSLFANGVFEAAS
jgi:hypothetical protein